MVEKNLDIAAIKKRYEAATKGPWVIGEVVRRRGLFIDCPKGFVAEAVAWPDSPACVESGTDEHRANAEFISHARTDIPLLVTALEEAQRLLQRWCYAKGGAEQERLFEEAMVALGESK